MMGAERRSVVMSEEERKNTAYHESGHAVVAKLLPKADPGAQSYHYSARAGTGCYVIPAEQDQFSWRP